MPFDQKRINGPDVSIPYSLHIDTSVKQSENEENIILNREDARAHVDLRKMCKVMLELLRRKFYK